MTQLVSIDPGKDGHIGIATWLLGGVLLGRRVMDFDILVQFLEMNAHLTETVVVEDFVLDHRAAKQMGSPMAASQVLGAVKSFTIRHGAELVVQKNTVLKPAAMHAGVPIPANGHFKDDVAAMLHGFYYFESIGMRARDIQV